MLVSGSGEPRQAALNFTTSTCSARQVHDGPAGDQTRTLRDILFLQLGNLFVPARVDFCPSDIPIMHLKGFSVESLLDKLPVM